MGHKIIASWNDDAEPVADAKVETKVQEYIDEFNRQKKNYDDMISYTSAHAKPKDNVRFLQYKSQKPPKWATDIQPAYVEYRVEICNETMFNQFRISVLRKQISENEIEFVYKGTVLKCDSYGRLLDYPKGFCDIVQNQLMTLVNEKFK